MDMDGCSAGEVVARLPDDPLVEILSRVPAKSICRFKCVSKNWRDLIGHPDHRKKLRQAMQGLFYTTTKIPEDDDSEIMMRFGFIDLAARSVPLDIDPCFSFLRERLGGGLLVILDSCNGLILFGHGKDDVWEYVVCNPTTKRWGVVPFGGSPAPPELTITKLAFDPAVSSHFYLVQVVVDENEGDLMPLQVYSSETGIWSLSHSETDEQEEQGEWEGWQGEWEGWSHQFGLRYLSGPSMPHSAFLNGFLHFMVSGSHLDQIVALDVQGHARRMIKAPVSHRRGPWFCYLGQSQGKPHYITEKLRLGCEEGDRLDISVLQDYGKEEWELKDAVSFTVVSEGFGDSITEFDVVCIHPDRNVVFFSNGLTLTAYDMDHKKASVVTTLGDEDQLCIFARYVPSFSESPSLANEH